MARAPEEIGAGVARLHRRDEGTGPGASKPLPAAGSVSKRAHCEGEEMLKVLVIHGPNLNLLGTREPDIYGSMTLEQINEMLHAEAEKLGMELRIEQSNHEGGIVELIHEAAGWANAIVINPAAYTHTSVAIYDALRAVRLPAVEVHLSNTAARSEEYRHRSITAPACVGVIAGFHAHSYVLALHAIKRLADTGQL